MPQPSPRGERVPDVLRATVVTVLTTTTADLDTVAYEMTMLVEEAGGIFAPAAG